MQALLTGEVRVAQAFFSPHDSPGKVRARPEIRSSSKEELLKSNKGILFDHFPDAPEIFFLAHFFLSQHVDHGQRHWQEVIFLAAPQSWWITVGGASRLACLGSIYELLTRTAVDLAAENEVAPILIKAVEELGGLDEDIKRLPSIGLSNNWKIPCDDLMKAFVRIHESELGQLRNMLFLGKLPILNCEKKDETNWLNGIGLLWLELFRSGRTPLLIGGCYKIECPFSGIAFRPDSRLCLGTDISGKQALPADAPLAQILQHLRNETLSPPPPPNEVLQRKEPPLIGQSDTEPKPQPAPQTPLRNLPVNEIANVPLRPSLPNNMAYLPIKLFGQAVLFSATPKKAGSLLELGKGWISRKGACNQNGPQRIRAICFVQALDDMLIDKLLRLAFSKCLSASQKCTGFGWEMGFDRAASIRIVMPGNVPVFELIITTALNLVKDQGDVSTIIFASETDASLIQLKECEKQCADWVREIAKNSRFEALDLWFVSGHDTDPCLREWHSQGFPIALLTTEKGLRKIIPIPFCFDFEASSQAVLEFDTQSLAGSPISPEGS